MGCKGTADGEVDGEGRVMIGGTGLANCTPLSCPLDKVMIFGFTTSNWGADAEDRGAGTAPVVDIACDIETVE